MREGRLKGSLRCSAPKTGRVFCADAEGFVEGPKDANCELEPNADGKDVEPKAGALCCTPKGVKLEGPKLGGVFNAKAEPPKGCAKGAVVEAPKAGKEVAGVEL